MFKLLFYILLNLTITVSCFAQATPIESKPQFDQSQIDHLLKKSKNQKITAWSMLGGGTLLALIGFGGAVASGYSDALGGVEPQKNSTADVLFYTGFISMVGSIPLFIISGKNKKKAKAMVGTTYYPNPISPTHLKTMPSAGIQITLR
jgi:hypothetical protein